MIYIGIGLACGVLGFYLGLLAAQKAFGSLVERYTNTHDSTDIMNMAHALCDLFGKDFYEEMIKE